jgi:hypothetical protein
MGVGRVTISWAAWHGGCLDEAEGTKNGHPRFVLLFSALEGRREDHPLTTAR